MNRVKTNCFDEISPNFFNKVKKRQSSLRIAAILIHKVKSVSCNAIIAWNPARSPHFIRIRNWSRPWQRFLLYVRQPVRRRQMEQFSLGQHVDERQARKMCRRLYRGEVMQLAGAQPMPSPYLSNEFESILEKPQRHLVRGPLDC